MALRMSRPQIAARLACGCGSNGHRIEALCGPGGGRGRRDRTVISGYPLADKLFGYCCQFRGFSVDSPPAFVVCEPPSRGLDETYVSRWAVDNHAIIGFSVVNMMLAVSSWTYKARVRVAVTDSPEPGARYDYIVVGSGVGGARLLPGWPRAACACCFSKRAWKAQVVRTDPPPPPRGRAEGIPRHSR
jgi:hypothetical protein